MAMARFLFPLGGAGSLLLCLWLSGCLAVWRYRTNTGRYLALSTRTTIYLEYEGTMFVEWDISLFCYVAEYSSPNTTLNCPVPGTHKIKPVVSTPTFEDEERYLSVISDVNCFEWYVHRLVPDSESSDIFSRDQQIITWIMDPENADPSELNHTATSPPPYSRILSKQFWNLGQRPVAMTFFKEIQYAAVASPEEGIWKMTMPLILDDIFALIYGKAVTFQDCFAFDTPFVFGLLWHSLIDNANISISSPPGSNIMISWTACYETQAVLVTDVGTFYTADGFETSKELKFPLIILDPALAHSIKQVALTQTDIFILIESSLYMVSDDEIDHIGENYNIPETDITGVRTKTWCSPQYPREGFLSDIIIWTKYSIFTGQDSEHFFQIIDMAALKTKLRLPVKATLEIRNICFDSLPNEIAVLIECTECLPTKILYLAAYVEDRGVWVLRDFSLAASSSTGPLHMEVLYSASTSMLLWDDDKVYYTYKNNKINGYLKVSGTNTEFSAASEGTTIHQIIIDYNGNTIIKLKNNTAFFLKFGMKDVVKLPVWEKEYRNFTFYSIPLDGMFILTLDGHTIQRQRYPMKSEVFSATFLSQDVCPYISFQHNMNSNIYYLDKGQNVTFWTQIVFLENMGLSVEVGLYRPELLKQRKHLQYEIARGICTKNLTVTLYHEEDYSELYNYQDAIIRSRGIMTVEVKPVLSGKTCTGRHKVSHIRVGCPPTSRLHIVKPELCPDHANITYTIPWEHLRIKSERDLELHYDVARFGCLIDAHYADPFRPVVLLNVGTSTVKPVDADYALWEVNGRDDFHYKATMKEAGCLRNAQGWSKVLPGKVSGLLPPFSELDSVWGPHNYLNCFEAELGQQTELDDEYEILNLSDVNAIIWPKYYTGIFLFRLRILDPNYSFCDLTAYFAVRTFGTIERLNIATVASLSILAATLFLGILVCSYFRYVKIFRTLSFVDPLLSLHPHLSATETAEELKKDE